MTKPAARTRGPVSLASVVLMLVLVLPWTVAGLLLIYASTILPLVRYYETLSWRETSCSIVSSRLAKSPDPQDELYTPDIVFSYAVEGQVYRSSRITFSRVTAYVPEKTARAALAPYPTGGRTVCYYDPDDPSLAVLDPGVSMGSFGLGLLGLMFSGAGVGGLGYAVHRLRQATKGSSPAPPPARRPAVPAGGAGSPELTPSPGRLRRFLRYALLALVSNAVVASFGWQVYRNLRAERPVTLLAWLLLPLAVAGLVLFLFAVRRLLAFFNPLPRLILSPAVPMREQSTDLQWWLTGDVERVRRLRIVLEGPVVTEEDAVESTVLVDTTEPGRMASGQVSFTLPLAAVQSRWKLRVATEVASGPDIVEDFPVPMRPL